MGRGRSSSSAGGPSKASTIQDRVKNLLQDSQSTSPQRTASGYGRFTEKEGEGREKPSVGKKPVALPQGAPVQELTYGRVRNPQQPGDRPPTSGSTTASPGVGRQPTGQRPTAPPKPKALRTGGQGDDGGLPPLASKPSALAGRPIQEGAPTGGYSDGGELGNVALNADADEWEARFTKRFPSLSGLEMVETEVPSGRSR